MDRFNPHIPPKSQKNLSGVLALHEHLLKHRLLQMLQTLVVALMKVDEGVETAEKHADLLLLNGIIDYKTFGIRKNTVISFISFVLWFVSF